MELNPTLFFLGERESLSLLLEVEVVVELSSSVLDVVEKEKSDAESVRTSPGGPSSTSGDNLEEEDDASTSPSSSLSLSCSSTERE